MKSYYFTSESVSEGHPDKIADQISDAILDKIIIQDKYARVACETYIKSNIVVVGGEITSHANININNIVKNTLKNIGFTKESIGFDINCCSILNIINKQSVDINLGIKKNNFLSQGAGDQGIMFGYATNETKYFMPAPIVYAHRLLLKQSKLRRNNILPWLMPDAKSQLTFRYLNNNIDYIDTVVFSTQHIDGIDYNYLKQAIMSQIILTVLPKKWLNKKTKYFINPSGRFVIGGPICDCGLTGRKIIVDTYGGMARHGGGCFSGKDPTKIDRSGSYMARYIAKNIVAAKLADKCEIQLSYAIGLSQPTSLMIETFGTEKISLLKLYNLVNKVFDLRPGSIIKNLNLLQPIYTKTSVYGHFGRKEFPWEKIDKIHILKKLL